MFQEIDVSVGRVPRKSNPARKASASKPRKAARKPRRAAKASKPRKAASKPAAAPAVVATPKETKTMAKRAKKAAKPRKAASKPRARKPAGSKPRRRRTVKMPKASKTLTKGVGFRARKGTHPIIIRRTLGTTAASVHKRFRTSGTRSITLRKYKSGKAGYDVRSNPTFTVKHAVSAAVGFTLGLGLAELTDRFVATRATSQTKDSKVLYGQKAITAIRAKSDGMRLFAQAAGAGLFGLGAYLARRRSPLVTYGLGGVAVAFGAKGLVMVVTDHLMPALFASKKCGDMSSRLFPDKQETTAPACAGDHQSDGSVTGPHRPFVSAPASRGNPGQVGCAGCGPQRPYVRLSACSDVVLDPYGICRKPNGQVVPCPPGATRVTPEPRTPSPSIGVEDDVPDTSEPEVSGSTPSGGLPGPDGSTPSGSTPGGRTPPTFYPVGRTPAPSPSRIPSGRTPTPAGSGYQRTPFKRFGPGAYAPILRKAGSIVGQVK